MPGPDGRRIVGASAEKVACTVNFKFVAWLPAAFFLMGCVYPGQILTACLFAGLSLGTVLHLSIKGSVYD